MTYYKKIIVLLALPVALVLAVLMAPANISYAKNDKPCKVNFNSLKLTAKKGQYVGVEYTVDENCKPVLVQLFEGEGKPPELDDYEPVDQWSDSTSTSSGSSSVNMATNYNTCNTFTREYDPIFIPTVDVISSRNYSWNGSTVGSTGHQTVAHTYNGMWNLTGGPGSWIVSYGSTRIESTGWASFNCNGNPFCNGGPMYAITLYASVNVQANGSCTGYGQYNGTICNLNGTPCSVRTWTWRD